MAAMLFIVIYVIKEKRLKSVLSGTPAIKYLGVLCVLAFITSFVNNNEAGTLAAMILSVFFLVAAFARSVMTRNLFDKIVEVSCILSLFSFIVTLVQYVIDYSNLINYGIPFRVCSVFLNANYYAAVIETLVLFAIYQLGRVKTTKQKGLYAAVIILNSLGLYLTGCRTAVFALCAAALLMLLLNGKYKIFAVFIGSCILLAILMLAFPDDFPRVDNIVTDIGTRLQIWRRALLGILSHPFLGTGAMSFASFHFKIFGETVLHTHSLYLEPLLSFGILGTAMIVIYLKKNLSSIWKMRETKSDRGRFALALGLLTSVALHGVVDITAFGVQTGILLLLTLSMAGIQENTKPELAPTAGSIACLQDAEQSNIIFHKKNKPTYSDKNA